MDVKVTEWFGKSKIHLAQDKDKWRSLVTGVTKIWAKVYVHVTVHRNKFLFNKTN